MPRIMLKIAGLMVLARVTTFFCSDKTTGKVAWTSTWLPVSMALVWLLASPCAALSGKPPSFNDPCKKIDSLSRDPSSTREQWLEAINLLVVMHVSGKPAPAAKHSLFHAGKACLSLYRVSGNPEDLERAIKYLSDFNRHYCKGPYFIAALQALKEAHTIKRGLEARETSEAVSGQPQRVFSDSTAKAPKAATAEDHATKSELDRSYASQTALKDTGNAAKPQSRPPDWNGNASFHGNALAQDSQPPARKASKENRIAALPQASISDAPFTSQTARSSTKEFVVVVDPGHGGRDPGAVSRDGSLKEKDLTLEVARRFKAALEKKNRRIRVTLTRNDDRSLALQERTAIANSLNADLFVSIHCNAAMEGSAKGIETFFLDKASSPRAMKVAARENGIPLTKMSDLESTLLDLMVTSKKTESTELAKTVHAAMARGLDRSAFSGTKSRS